MRVVVIPGTTYAVTTATDCTVSTTDGVLIASCAAGEQTLFVAPGAEVEVSDDSALVTESFKGAPAGLSAVWGSIKKVSASLSSKLNVSTFNAHQANTTIHVTAQEREKWNSKQDNLTDESGNMTLAGNITVAGGTFDAVVNANGGINIPLAVGAPTDTTAVNRFYALGLAGEANILTTNAFINTEAITTSGTSTVAKTVPYHLASIKVPPGTHSTIQANFVGVDARWNYSSFAGFSFVWRATDAAKLTFGIGRGAKTVRPDLSIDSYSIIPANDLAHNSGEILDITFDNVRDTQRNGYTVRVREIYALDSTAGWQVKTTTSFIPASQNEPIPWTIAKVIYQQNASANIAQYDNLGTLWLMLTGGQANNLYKIATCRGVSTFETNSGISSWVTDVVNNSTGDTYIHAGDGEYTYYQPGGTNPVFYGLEAMAVDAIESEEAADFEDINIPL